MDIGSLVFDNMDQIDFTGPFEVLSRLPDSTCRVYGITGEPVRDVRGLTIVPDAAIADAPRLDVLHVPGGRGVDVLMENEEVLAWLRKQSGNVVLSVCTGALLLGAAGLLAGRRATTHWASLHLLPEFGAEVVDSRVVVDGDWIFAAGVTSGIDGALTLAARLCGVEVAQGLQLYMQYAPEPPFDAGTPETAPAAVLAAARADMAEVTRGRRETIRRIVSGHAHP
ncbi:DJ-1/PfpI family protein [Kutzneria kofuensis]|uniref:Cyclohexyl-isocyanide hydratase n=1 Tax=Kutzneria kofuensis TaxID=103725 RepID=A0A7W9KDC8_9PSEU|nr:DJ-1/PfpI family protein [Kutzneria kofuensis]MBB5890519.1 cyclohexyl-isocyanide hydratase [Kutzneria kofuensis]